MEHRLSIGERIGDFVKDMAPGTIYWELSDGVATAMHKDVYGLTSDDPAGNAVNPYKDYINSLGTGRDVDIIKQYYKAFNPMDAGDTSYVWVDLNKVIAAGHAGTDIYLAAWSFRDTPGYRIDVSTIKAVEYTAKDYLVHKIVAGDGGNLDEYVEIPVRNLDLCDKNTYSIEIFNIANPTMVGNIHLKNDIKISVKDGVEGTFEDSMVWVNGLFVKVVMLDVEFRSMAIINGKSLLDTMVKDYKPSSTPVPDYKPGTRFATALLDPEKAIYRYDFAIRIFQWMNTTVTSPESPTLPKFTSYYYEDPETMVTHDIDYLERIFFGKEIDADNHLLMYNGTVVDREEYSIVGNTIYLNSNLKRIPNIIARLKEVATDPLPKLGVMVEGELPQPGNYSLIRFSCKDPAKGMMVCRDAAALINYPYPFHITFPQFVPGDIVLLDGVYERYLLHSANSVQYPVTNYLSRYSDYNVLWDTKVTHLRMLVSKV